MDGKEVNKPCPCGSGIKYKNCYGKGRSDCKMFLKERKEDLWKNHQEREKKVIDFLNGAILEVRRVFAKDPDDSVVQPRLKVVTTLLLAEVFANCWDLYLARRTPYPQDRLRLWIAEFCTTEQNKAFKDSEKLQALTPEYIVEWRNGLFHFLGMGPKGMQPPILLSPSNLIDEEIREELGEMGKAFKKLGGISLRAPEIWEMMRQGGLLMFEVMMRNIRASGIDETKKWAHIEGMNRVYEKVGAEGATLVPLKKKSAQ